MIPPARDICGQKATLKDLFRKSSHRAIDVATDVPTQIDKQMKRPATVIVVLIILLVIIGFERIGNGFYFLISDDRVARAPRVDGAAHFEDTKSKKSSGEEQNSSGFDARPEDQGQADPNLSAGKDAGGSQGIKVSITGEISPMHFIRASLIFGSTKPSKEQIHRLHEAVNAVGESLRPGAVIFDADGISHTMASVFLFVREEFDLTAQVKAIYDALDPASNSPPAVAAKAER